MHLHTEVRFKMRNLIVILLSTYFAVANAGVYDTPPCYSVVPTTCTFNEMTLNMCNAEGKNKTVFVMSQRSHITGGNKFVSDDGKATCVVQRIKDTDPAKYDAVITK